MKINIKEIKEQYPSLKVWSDNHAAELYRRIQEHQLIKEFLYTVSIPKTIEHLKKQFSINAEPGDNDEQTITLWFEEVMTEKRIFNVNKFMDKFGYYPSTVLNYGGTYENGIKRAIGNPNIRIVYEAKYDKEIILTKPYLYHFTPDIAWTKIKNIGLTPKTHSKIANHPGRIYVLEDIHNLNDFSVEVEDIGFMLWNNSKTKDRVKEVYLLRIDVSKLPKDIKFFKDPNFMVGDAVWTYRNIPPNAIEVLKKFDTSEF